MNFMPDPVKKKRNVRFRIVCSDIRDQEIKDLKDKIRSQKKDLESDAVVMLVMILLILIAIALFVLAALHVIL